jgi:hypothetical protein
VLVVARFEPPEYSNLEDRLRQAFVHAGKYCERGPPFVTDDPEPPPPGGWEINIPFIIEHAAHGTEMDAPSISVTPSPIQRNASGLSLTSAGSITSCSIGRSSGQRSRRCFLAEALATGFKASRRGVASAFSAEATAFPNSRSSNWKDQDAALDQLVAEMNSASADKKLGAVATVLNKLVQQRKAMHEQMQKMTSANEKQGMCMCR